MSKYTQYYNSGKTTYYHMAARWAEWAKTANLTEAEITGMTKFFRSIAKRFGLINELKQLGIL